MSRYFLALDLTDHAKAQVANTLVQIPIKAKWVKPENYHITLLFLGLQSQAELRKVSVLAGNVASRYPAFEYILDGWGFFPNACKARVMFIGVGKGSDGISAVAGQIIGGAEPPDHFHPHLTVARFRQPLAAVIPTELSPIKVPAREITLFASQLTPLGPIYKAVDKFCFSGIARGE